MKRLGTPDDVAKVVALLLSDGATCMTGQIIHICGGLSVGAVIG